LIQRWSWRGLAGTLAIAACGAGVSSAGPSFGGVDQAAGQLTPLPVTRLDDRVPTSELDAPHAVSLTVVRAQPLRDILLQLVRGTRFSIVADDRAEGTFAGELKDLTARQALEAVLFSRDLDYDVQGSVIRVFPRKAVTRIFQIDYVNVRRPAAAGGVLDELTAGVERMLSTAGRAHVDRASGLVQVTDFTDRLDQISLYLEAVQLRASRQVRLEARVLEVTSGAAGQPIDWNTVAARSGSGVRRAAPGVAGLRVTDFGALVNVLGSQGSVRTIASSRLLALNNEPAILRVGVDGALVPAEKEGVAVPFDGLTLSITAQVAADGIVQLHVAPAAGLAAVDTLVRVQDGQTILLSGFLAERPHAIDGQAADTITRELVILLTPTVVVPGAAAVAGSR
jgi:MSHA biogenesis protein MshL